MSIHYLLDGYNIIHSAAMEELSLTARKFPAAQQRRNDERSEEFSCQMPISGQDRLEGQRDDLIRFIEQRLPQGSRKNNVTVVFDGNVDAFGGARSSLAKVVFSLGESADDRIRSIVADSDNAKNIIVVTDDRDIQYAVKALGAKVISVKKFLANGKPEKGKGKGLKGPSAATDKYISKTDEARINTEMGKIWLKSPKKDRQ